MTTDTPHSGRPDACPDAELLAAYVDGTLTPAERTKIEMHLIECAECRDVVGGAVALTEVIPAPIRVTPRRRWLAAAGALVAAAAAALIIIRMQRPSPYYVPEMADLVMAANRQDRRMTEGRLSPPFEYGAPPGALRGTEEIGRASCRE